MASLVLTDKRIPCGRRSGMALVEVVVAIGIFGVAALMCLYVLATSVNRNRSTELTVASTSAARQAIEEGLVTAESRIVSGATAIAPDSDVYKPMEFVKHLLSVKEDAGTLGEGYKVQRVGNPMTQIVYEYTAMVPGKAARDKDGKKKFETRGHGEGAKILDPDAARARVRMTVYLDESAVPSQPNGQLDGALWFDVNKPTATGRPGSFDMNGDGEIHKGGLLTNSDNPKFAPPASDIGGRYRRIAQLPVDVLVVYDYRRPKEGDKDPERYSQTSSYRMVISDFSELQ